MQKQKIAIPEIATPLSASRKQQSRLPKRFPVGTTYVVEGRGGEDGHLRVFSRYVVLPNGERINLEADFAGPAMPRARRSPNRSQNRTPNDGKRRPGGSKKNLAEAGTTRRHRR
jgi:hypothetical protein